MFSLSKKNDIFVNNKIDMKIHMCKKFHICCASGYLNI